MDGALPAPLLVSLQSRVTAEREVHLEVRVLSGHCDHVSNTPRTIAALTDLDAPEAVSRNIASFSSLRWALKMFGLLGFSGLGRTMPSVSVPEVRPLLRRVDTIL
jgi:hypothetical protein